MDTITGRQPGQNPESYLVSVLSRACEAARQVDPALLLVWEARQAEIGNGLVVTVYTRNWLSLQSNYWREKDREYAAYIDRLVATFRE